MRLAALFKKTMMENIRDWKIIILTLTFTPFFVFLMYFYIKGAASTFTVAVINHDQGIGQNALHLNAGDMLVAEMRNFAYPDGAPILKVVVESDLETAKQRLKEKSADLVVEIPRNFTFLLQEYRSGNRAAAVKVKTWGDAGSGKYMVAAATCDAVIYQYVTIQTGWDGPLALETETVGREKSLNDFDLYVPGLLALAVMMLMFTAAASIIREKDKETLIRLRLSKMNVGEFILSISLSQIIIGLAALGLALLSAMILGYRTSGSVLAILAVGALASLSVIAISVIVAAGLRTIFDLMTIGCFPFFVLMFFSGGMMPLPQIKWLTLGGRTVMINDILPTTHAINALTKVMNFGAGLKDVQYEMAAMALLTALFFFFGIWLFHCRHLKLK